MRIFLCLTLCLFLGGCLNAIDGWINYGLAKVIRRASDSDMPLINTVEAIREECKKEAAQKEKTQAKREAYIQRCMGEE